MAFKGFQIGGAKKPFAKPFGAVKLSTPGSAAPSTKRAGAIFDDEDDQQKMKLRKLDDVDDEKEDKNVEEDDALDSFMESVSQKLTEESSVPKSDKPTIAEFEEKDEMEEFLVNREKRLAEEAVNGTTVVQTYEYDDEDRPIVDIAKKRAIEPLPQIYHSEIEYEPFEKELYDECEEITNMTEAEIRKIRKDNDIRITGENFPRPVTTFAQLGLDDSLMKIIEKQGFQRPTPIQMQTIPIGLSGRDLIGIAKTGSGKTVAFVLPLLIHVMAQRIVEKGEGPIGLIMAPTRELADQIFLQTKIFARAYDIRVAGLTGGRSKYEQSKELVEGVEIIVCTPGRLIDMVKKKVTSLHRCTYLVLDEADRMFDLGFELQVRSIVGQIRPSRQTLLFSATFKKEIETLANDILTDPLRVSVGQQGQANEDVTQVVKVLTDDSKKWGWLMETLPLFLQSGNVLIFVSQKGSADELSTNLARFGHPNVSIHGDKVQQERSQAIKDFKKGLIKIMVATDVAARGLDIKEIKTVVNFDVARNIESHVHRIGRTGRAGAKDGVAYTLITPQNARFAGELVWNLEGSNQDVTPELLAVAKLNPRFNKGAVRGKGRRDRGGRMTRNVPAIGGDGDNARVKKQIAGLGFDADPVSSHVRPPPPISDNEEPLVAGDHPANVRAEWMSRFQKANAGGEGGSWTAGKS